MSLAAEEAAWFAQTFGQLVANIEKAVMGKRREVWLAVTCLLSDGHLLLEDVPGTGKTLLARAIARTVQGTHSRVQFTPDLLPSDVTGVTVFDQRSNRFEFHRGPIFATIVLADEINRASPKTQSALLEVMEEGQVTVDGTAHEVGRPFMVIATQNPIEQAGTYPLPEAQLDRFLMRTSLDHPDHDTTVALLADASSRDRARTVPAIVTSDVVAQMADMTERVHVDHALLSYISRLAEETRRAELVRLGVSTRGCLAMVRVARTWAAANGRTYVVPDDIRDLALPVLTHRIVLSSDAVFDGVDPAQIVSSVLADVPPPRERGVA